MSRKMMDCREMPDSNCSIFISGEESEVLKLATEHVVSAHGMKDTPETRAMLRQGLKDEPREWSMAKPPFSKEELSRSRTSLR